MMDVLKWFGCGIQWFTLAHVLSKKMIYIHFFLWYEISRGLAIIKDFTAHWAIKSVQMANVWKFVSMSE